MSTLKIKIESDPFFRQWNWVLVEKSLDKNSLDDRVVCFANYDVPIDR